MCKNKRSECVIGDLKLIPVIPHVIRCLIQRSQVWALSMGNPQKKKCAVGDYFTCFNRLRYWINFLLQLPGLCKYFIFHATADDFFLPQSKGDNTFGTIHPSGRPKISFWGAKVVIWVLVGCEPTHWVQNWLVGCNLRIYMRTLLLEVKGLEGQGQRSRGSMSKVTSTESISKDLGNIGLGQIRFPNKGRMVHIIIHWWNSPCLCSDQSGGSFGQSIVIYLRLN